MTDPTFTELDCIANELYCQACRRAEVEPVHWWALADNRREHFLQAAREYVEAWATSEVEQLERAKNIHGSPPSIEGQR